MAESCIDSALRYLQMGLSVIPCDRAKKPLVPWKEYQQRKPSSQEVQDWWRKMPGANVAIVTGGVSQVLVIDEDEPEQSQAVLRDLLPDSQLFPMADTPSGGTHSYFKMLEPVGNNTRIVPGADLRADGGYVLAAPSRTEKGHYVWRPRLSIFDVPPPPCPSAYLRYIKEKQFFRGGVDDNTADNTEGPSDNKRSTADNIDNILLFSEGRRDDDLFRAANALVKGGLQDPEILQILEVIANGYGEPLRGSELRRWLTEKVASARRRQGAREGNFTEEVRSIIRASKGLIRTTELQQATTATTREERKKLNVIIGRFMKEGLLERVSAGTYRRVDQDVNVIDFMGAQTDRFPLKLPLLLDEVAHIYARNIIVVAGEQNSGKTGFCLRTADMNAERMPVVYFSSEMGEQELRLRLSRFKRPLESWKRHVKFVERCSDFHDLTTGDRALFIIDYLEISEHFYKMGEHLAKIHEKLRDGVCLVAIQKDKGKEFGRGQSFSLEKPRLYVTLEPNRLRVVKAKNFPEGMNPNGRACDFKLVNGCDFIITRGFFDA